MRCPDCEGTGCSCKEVPVAQRERAVEVCCGLCNGSGVVSAFSPEAVQAAAQVTAIHLAKLVRREDVPEPYVEFLDKASEVVVLAALAAAWATDFGDPSDYQGADHE